MSADHPKGETPAVFLSRQHVMPAEIRAEIELALLGGGAAGRMHMLSNGQMRTLSNGQVEIRTKLGVGIISREQIRTILDGTASAAVGEQAAANPARQAEPPQLADLCLSLLLSGANGEAIIGDLSEHFHRDRAHFGVSRARTMYWGRTLRSLWPLMRRAIGRAIKWGVVIESVRRFFILSS